MQFDLDELNPGVWFDYPETEARACVRVLNHEAQQEIERQTVTKQVEYVQGHRYEYETCDEDLQNELTWDYCITGLENFKDAKGADLACTRETKCRLMRGSLDFAGFITRCMVKVHKMHRERLGEREKNLPTSQPG